MRDDDMLSVFSPRFHRAVEFERSPAVSRHGPHAIHLKAADLPAVITARDSHIVPVRQPRREHAPQITAVPVDPPRAVGLPTADGVSERWRAPDNRNEPRREALELLVIVPHDDAAKLCNVVCYALK